MKYYWSISILIIILSVSYNFTLDGDCTSEILLDSTFQNGEDYEIHEPIIIESENDLNSQDWPGNGTENFPYKIEKLNITSATPCILVSNIAVYLIIKDCILVAAHPASRGCIIGKSRYVQIADCFIDSQSRGLELYNSTECIASNNSISGCPYGGLVVTDSLDCIFANNSLFDCGILVYGDSVNNWRHDFIDNIVNEKKLGYFSNSTGSEIDGELYGQMILVNCENIYVNQGQFSQTFIGIQVIYSRSLIISQAVIRDNSYSGISVIYSENITINDSEVHGSGFAGIEIHNSRISVNNNIIHGNMHAGILSHTSILDITDNRIFSNRGYGGIYIFNASDECVIKSNMVYLNQMLGISLIDINECIISNNYVEGHRNSGINIVRSKNCVCEGNTLVNNVEGLYIRETGNCEISGNRISGSDDYALHIFSMTEVNIFNNTIIRNWNYGLYLNEIISSFISYNHVYENGGTGIYFHNSTNCLVDLNNIHHNDNNGIRLVLSDDFYIQYNSLHGNDLNGMHLSNSNYNEIRDNRFFENREYGILLSNSDDNIILNNSFYLNQEGNARDDGNQNRWDWFLDSWEGNWWDDWNGSEVYYIEGNAGSVDRSPSLYIISTTISNTTTPGIKREFSSRIVIALCFVIVAVLAMTVWNRKRK